MAASSFACVPHVMKDMYVTYAFTFTSGGLLKWYRNCFGQLYAEEAVRTGKNIYTVIIENATKSPSDLFLLPHFAGAATPYMDTESKGMIAGLTLNTQPNEVAKAILEGITYEMMVNLEKLDEVGIAIRELRAVGGLAQSETFLQLKADMMGRRIVSLNVSEAGTLGVAMLAGTAIGVYRTLDEAVSRLVKMKKVFEPDSKLMHIYQEKYQTYKNMYPAVKMIYNQKFKR
jgi:xylulokinase